MFKIEPYLSKIEKICKKYEAKSLVLFGSALSEKFDPDNSDLDFLLELRTAENGFDNYFVIKMTQKNSWKKEYLSKFTFLLHLVLELTFYRNNFRLF